MGALETAQAGGVEANLKEHLDLFKRRRFWGRSMIWAAVFVIVPLILGTVGTAVGMVRAFGQLSEIGQADPQVLAKDISIALHSTVWGLWIAGPAFFFLIISMVRYISLPLLTPESQ